jgi:hypothetical protein
MQTVTAPRFRERFPTLADSTYLASHSMGPPPLAARDALLAYWEAWAKDGPEAWNAWMPELESLADNLGSIIGAPAGSLSLAPNVSVLQAAIASSLDWRGARNEVIFEDLQFPSVTYVWKAWERFGALITRVPSDDGRTMSTERIVGAITENDIMLASASNAMVVGFNVRPNAEARSLADREGVEIRTYRVIYQLTEDIEQALVGMLKPVRTEETIGEVEVRQLFRVSRLGTIAGSYVTNGVVRRNSNVRILREGTVVYETKISQLKRFKDDVREVEEGFECGILLEGYNDLKEGDVLEVYETREVERTDLDTPAPAPTPAAQ